MVLYTAIYDKRSSTVKMEGPKRRVSLVDSGLGQIIQDRGIRNKHNTTTTLKIDKSVVFQLI